MAGDSSWLIKHTIYYFLGKCSDDPENIDWIPTIFNYKQARSKSEILLFLNKNSRLSTNSCLSLLTDKIKKGFVSGEHRSLTLNDLQKAFDAIDHEIGTS